MSRDVTDKEKLKILNQYYDYDKQIRGKFLIQMNWNEDFLEQIISKLLINEANEIKRQTIILLLRRTSFDNKVNVFVSLTKEFLPEFEWEKYHLSKKLKDTQNIRNLFAHSVMDLRDEFLDLHLKDTVQYERKKDGKTIYEKFTKKKLKEYVDLVFQLTNDLVTIDDHIDKKFKTS